jgi:hypothetical protein
MDDLSHISDADFDRLLAGKARGGTDDVEVVAAFFKDVKSRYTTPPSPATRQDHLAKIVAAARLNAEQAATPTGVRFGVAPGGRPDRGHRWAQWRRRLVFGGVSVTAKVALIGVVAATAATGGLAAAGALPSPLQSAVAGAAGNVGVKLPNPQASAQIQTNAHVQAGKVASTVHSMVERVTTAAQQPPQLTPSAIASTQTCAQNVSTIASQLVNSAAGANTSALAQSLAERATALAQESVGCALPAAAGAVAGSKTPAIDAARDSAAAKAISGAIQGCASTLESAIQTLVQAAILAKAGTQVQGISQDAKTVATAAQACAQGVGSALQGVLASLPVLAAPKVPAGTTPSPGNGFSGLLNLVPNLPKTLPTVVPTTGAGAAAAANAASTAAAWWTQFLSKLPAGYTGNAGVTGSASGNGYWSGVTGSWNGSGSWNPYPSTPGSTAGSPTPGSTPGEDQPQPTHHH